MRSERLTFLVTPEEKTAIQAKADHLGLTASDVVRLAVEAFSLEGVEELEALSKAFADTMAECRVQLESVNSRVEASLAELDASRLEQKAAA